MLKPEKIIGGVLAGKAMANLFAMVRIAEPNLLHFNIRQLNQKQSTFVPVNKLPTNRCVMAVIRNYNKSHLEEKLIA